MKDKPRQTSRQGIAIVHRSYGEFWSRELFDNEAAARKCFDDFWLNFPTDDPPKWSQYRLVKARQTLVYVGEITQ